MQVQRLTKKLKLERWYLVYTLIGAAIGGILPVVVPLLAFKRFGGVWHVGLVMAAYNLGGLFAPVWGYLADRHYSQRRMLIGSLVTTSVVLAALFHADGLFSWLGLSLAEGIGVTGAVTLGTLFITRNHPKKEWSERVGSLQMCNGCGQVVGMLLVALLNKLSLSSSLLIASAMMALAVLPVRFTPGPTTVGVETLQLFGSIATRVRCTQDMSLDRLKRACLPRIKEKIRRLQQAFIWLMVVWFLSLTGSSVVSTLYPVIMQDGYGMGQRSVALGFALALGLSAFLSLEAGRLAKRFGPKQMLKVIMQVRIIAFVGLFSLLSIGSGKGSFLALVAFLVIFLCWPVIGISSTILVAQFSASGQGEGLGIFNAVMALAAVFGAAIGGWLASWSGYAASMGLVVVTEMSGLAVLEEAIICRSH